MNPNHASRDGRQRDIVPPDRLAACQVTVIGVGAVGRQVALQLAAMGVAGLQLIDHDRVEDVNLAAQAYFEEDLGALKVEATAGLCRRLNSDVEVETVPRRFGRSMPVNGVVVACVDSIETRRFIWQAVHDRVRLFVDGRMLGESLRVLAASDAASRIHYPTTLFPAAEAHRGACTSKSTIYAAAICAGSIVVALSRWLRGLPVDQDVSVNLLASEMMLNPEAA